MGKKELDSKIKDQVITLLPQELNKYKQMELAEAMRFRNVRRYNDWVNPDAKLGSDVPFSMLRRMAIMYPIARACINRRIRQITGLGWDITTIDDIAGESGNDKQIEVVKTWLKRPMGHKTRMREMLTIMVDDILTVDAVSFEIARMRGGVFDPMRGLIPVDPTTIVLRLNEYGATPEPPETAYCQYIQGMKTAEFTTDDLIYEMMGSRSYSPYGLAPLESLIVQIEGALRGDLYNLGYFREGNVPEGFITLPEEVVHGTDGVEEWQTWFDSLVAGDPRMMHRLKILPGGAEYTPAKKPEDMAFEKFEMFVLQETCAVFDVPPQEIGITYQVNKATADSQAAISREKGLIPLANFIKEVLDSVIQEELGFTDLQFIWTDVNPKDRKEEVDIAKLEIEMGAKSVDEYRIEQGLEPIGLNHYIIAGGSPILVEDFLEGETTIKPEPIQPLGEDGKPMKPAEDDKEEKPKDEETEDLKRWRKAIYNDLEQGRPLRVKFPSKFINPETHKLLSDSLSNVKSRHQAKLLFDQFLDPEVKASYKLLKLASDMRKLEDEDLLKD